MPHSPLSGETHSTCSNDRQSPRVGGFLGLGPEAVLGCLVLGEFVGLDRVGLGVLLLLVCLVLSVATDVPQECVVGCRGEEGDGMKLARSPQEEREREVNESVTKVAGITRLVQGQSRTNGSRHILGVAHDAPDTFAVQSSISSLLLMFIELVIRKDLEGESSTKNKDGSVVSPFERS